MAGAALAGTTTVAIDTGNAAFQRVLHDRAARVGLNVGLFAVVAGVGKFGHVLS
jgi:hypothetical protein